MSCRKAQRTLSELRRFGYNNSFTSISQNDGPLLQVCYLKNENPALRRDAHFVKFSF